MSRPQTRAEIIRSVLTDEPQLACDVFDKVARILPNVSHKKVNDSLSAMIRIGYVEAIGAYPYRRYKGVGEVKYYKYENDEQRSAARRATMKRSQEKRRKYPTREAYLEARRLAKPVPTYAEIEAKRAARKARDRQRQALKTKKTLAKRVLAFHRATASRAPPVTFGHETVESFLAHGGVIEQLPSCWND